MGLIADEVEQVLPEWVVTSPTGYKAITTTGMDALVVEAIREPAEHLPIQRSRNG